LDQEAAAFDELLSASADGPSLRELLKTPRARADVRRTINAAIAERIR